MEMRRDNEDCDIRTHPDAILLAMADLFPRSSLRSTYPRARFDERTNERTDETTCIYHIFTTRSLIFFSPVPPSPTLSPRERAIECGARCRARTGAAGRRERAAGREGGGTGEERGGRGERRIVLWEHTRPNTCVSLPVAGRKSPRRTMARRSVA